MFFNLDKKDMAFIKQPISKTKEGENETGFIPRLTEILLSNYSRFPHQPDRFPWSR